MIDCHLHLQDGRFAPHLPGIFAVTRALGVRRMVVNGTHPGDWDSVASLAARFPEVIPCYGLHPWKVGSEPGDWLGDLEARLRADPRAGVGEIGLDRWIKDHDLVRQQEAFISQLALADSLGRPVTIHCLQAWGPLVETLGTVVRPRAFLLHSYGGPVELVGRLTALGAFFSISGYFFRPGKEHKLAVFDQVPRHRLLIETDAPEMAPPPAMIRFSLPGNEDPRPNHPGNLATVYEAVGHRLGIAKDDLVACIDENFRTWFDGAAASTADRGLE